MPQIQAGQIKAARAILDWSQEDLANVTGLSIATIRNLEAGFISPRHSTTNVICQAVENAGLEFIDPEGVRRRTDEIKIYQGRNSAGSFYEDVLGTVKKAGKDLVIVIDSQKMLAKACGISAGCMVNDLEKLGGLAEVKCILSEEIESALSVHGFQFRTISKHYAGPVSYFIYGDKYALVLCEGVESFKFVVFQSMALALSYRNHFTALWNTAAPLVAQANTKTSATR